MRAVVATAALLGALAACALAACGTTPEKACPADEPATCPASGSPSYATDVAPLITTYCTTQCHKPGGTAADRLLSTYDDLKKVGLDDVHSQLYDCLMPMSPAADPTTAERITMLTWFTCGALDN